MLTTPGFRTARATVRNLNTLFAGEVRRMVEGIHRETGMHLIEPGLGS
jgi:hypothetical protein